MLGCRLDHRLTLTRPDPPIYLRLIDAVLISIGLAFELHEAQLFLRVRAAGTKGRDSINDVHRNGEAINLIANGQIERSVDVAFFLIAADVQVLVIGAPISEPVNQPRVTVKVEDDGFVLGEQSIEVAIGQAVRMLARRGKAEKIDNINEPDLEIREVLA